MGRNSLYAGYDVDLVKVPQLAVVFQGIKDAKYPWDIFGKESIPATDDKDKDITDTEDSSDLDKYRVEDTVKNTDENSDKDTVNNTNQNTDKDTIKNTDETTTTVINKNTENTNVKESDSQSLSQNKPSNDSTGKTNTKGNTVKTNTNTNNNNNTITEDSETKSFEKVDKNYFKDALFIGDSRTIGLQEYSGLEEPTYYASTGISIYEIFDKDIAKVDGKMMTVDKALENKKFAKIYIMLGINELGTGTAKSFAKEYKSAVEEIQKLQPDATIFIQSIMNVSKKKSDNDKIFNNSNIKERNNELSKIADSKKIFYIDVNEAFSDDAGPIPANYTFDGIHLKAPYYKLWSELLFKYGIK
jgi:hypothetical protein